MSEEKKFRPDMTIGDAMRLHPRAAEVFMSFHLGGCSHCSISEAETIEQVAAGYGVPIEMLMESLNGLLETEEAPKTEEAPTEEPAHKE